MDHLGFVQAVNGFGQGVVVGIADATDGRLDPGFSQTFRVTDRDVLHASVTVVDQTALGRSTGTQRLPSASSTKSVRDELDTFQPTIRRANTSITNAT